jgi:hypothetical protein
MGGGGKGGSGKGGEEMITFDKLKAITRELGEKISDDEIWDMIKFADTGMSKRERGTGSERRRGREERRRI